MNYTYKYYTEVTDNMITCQRYSVMIMFDIVTYKKTIIKNSNFLHARSIDTVWGHVILIVHKYACHMLAS